MGGPMVGGSEAAGRSTNVFELLDHFQGVGGLRGGLRPPTCGLIVITGFAKIISSVSL